MDEEQNKRIVELGQSALHANKEHLSALKTYTQKLEAELEAFDKLLEAADAIDETDLDVGCSATIPGSVRATTPIATKGLLSPESPFYEDALKRRRYQSFSEVHPMKARDLGALADAVQAENHRMLALDRQTRGDPAFPNTGVEMAHIRRLNPEGIDWDRISEKVSVVSMSTRTARECEIRWFGEQHPEFNREPWGDEEVLKVKTLASEFVDSRPDWVTIAKRLGTKRTPLDCMRHATSRNSRQWTVEGDERLLRAIRMYGHDNWYLVARYVSEDATPIQCSNRFQRTLDKSVKRTAWSPEEDARLTAAVAAYGSSWVDVAANVPGRYNDQCRDRWIEQLNPDINRSQWSEEEDKLLLDCVREHKNASWKEISEQLRNGRTGVMCRNRHAILKRGVNDVLAMPPANSEAQMVDEVVVSSDSVSASTGTLCFKTSFPDLQRCPTTPTSHHGECHRPKQFVFLEPVVSSEPDSQKHRRPHSSQHTTKFKMMTIRDAPAPNTTTKPSSRKRKMQSNVARSNKSLTEARPEEPTG